MKNKLYRYYYYLIPADTPVLFCGTILGSGALLLATTACGARNNGCSINQIKQRLFFLKKKIIPLLFLYSTNKY